MKEVVLEGATGPCRQWVTLEQADSWHGKRRLGEAYWAFKQLWRVPFLRWIVRLSHPRPAEEKPGVRGRIGLRETGSPWKPGVPPPSSSHFTGSPNSSFTNLGQVYAWPHERKPVLIHLLSGRGTQGSPTNPSPTQPIRLRINVGMSPQVPASWALPTGRKRLHSPITRRLWESPSRRIAFWDW